MNKLLTGDYNKIQKLFIKHFGQDNHSIAITEDKMIFSSHQIFEQLHELIYMENLNSTITKNNILIYSANISCLINSFCEGIKTTKLGDYITSKEKSIDRFDINLIDDEINNSRYFNYEYDSEIVLFLLKILTTINFTIYVLPKIINKNSNLYVRYMVSTYISSCKSLHLLKNNLINLTNLTKKIKNS